MNDTILIVDDDVETRAIWRTYFEHRGKRVLEARDGYACLDLARAEQPDAIVLDLILPGLDGWRVAQELRSDRTTSNIPIIAVSGRVMAADREGALSAGVDLFLAKPIDPVDLLLEIEALLASVREREGTAAQAEPTNRSPHDAQQVRRDSHRSEDQRL